MVGVNADFYDMTTGAPSGALVMEGVEYHGVGSENFFAILEDGTAEEIAQIMLEAGCVGALFARLDAMKIAKGRYFMFLDADDAYLPDALHEVRTGILSYTKRNH